MATKTLLPKTSITASANYPSWWNDALATAGSFYVRNNTAQDEGDLVFKDINGQPLVFGSKKYVQDYVSSAIAGVPVFQPSGINGEALVVTYENGIAKGSRNLIEADIPSLTEAKIADFEAKTLQYAQSLRLNQFATPTGNVDLGGYELTGLANPSTAQSAATKSYVDTQILDAVTSAREIVGEADASLATPQAATGQTTFNAGDMFRITAAGQAFGSQANVGDYVMYGSNGSWMVLDGVDAAVIASPSSAIVVSQPNENTYSISITTGEGIEVNNGSLRAYPGNGLGFSADSRIEIRSQGPLSFSPQGELTLQVAPNAGLTTVNDQLAIASGAGITLDSQGAISANLGDGLSIVNGAIELDFVQVGGAF